MYLLDMVEDYITTTALRLKARYGRHVTPRRAFPFPGRLICPLSHHRCHLYTCIMHKQHAAGWVCQLAAIYKHWWLIRMGFLKIRANDVGYPSYGGCFVWVGNIVTPLLCRKFGLLCTDLPMKMASVTKHPQIVGFWRSGATLDLSQPIRSVHIGNGSGGMRAAAAAFSLFVYPYVVGKHPAQ